MFSIFFSKRISKISELKLNIPIFTLKQIHSDKIVVLENENMIKNLYEGDSIITKLKNVAIGIKTADCLPILAYDSKNKIIAAIHSGWRGTVNRIIEKTINFLVNNYATDKENLVVFLGPSICKKCYSVKEDVFSVFKMEFKNMNYEKRDDCYHIDLKKINLEILINCGVNEKNIYVINDCTSCKNNEYQSYRINKNTKNFQINYIYMQ